MTVIIIMAVLYSKDNLTSVGMENKHYSVPQYLFYTFLDASRLVISEIIN